MGFGNYKRRVFTLRVSFRVCLPPRVPVVVRRCLHVDRRRRLLVAATAVAATCARVRYGRGYSCACAQENRVRRLLHVNGCRACVCVTSGRPRVNAHVNASRRRDDGSVWVCRARPNRRDRGRAATTYGHHQAAVL